VRCAKCGKENRADARFCRGCGEALARACAACGAELPEDAGFCDRCGARAADAPAPAPASYTPPHLAARIRATSAALEGERKPVTVLFADVVDSTAIAERIDPEEMRALMDRCFGHMLDEVHRFEGTVNQFTGDGIMALFGAPLALEDAPRQAVRAALAIQRTLAAGREEIRAASGVDLQIRIGVHTGLVVVGRIGNDLRMEYTAIGDTTNLASRLQSLARPGTVVVSEATQRLAGAFFDLRDLGLRTVKGKAEPVRVFEVEGERAARGRVEAHAAQGLTPLAGRRRELAALRQAFDAACGGHGHVAFVVGEAGIGKSRLLYEFRGELAGERHAWVEGRCASSGSATAFLPLADMWRRSLGIEDADDERAALAKVDDGIAALGDDLRWTAPFVRQLLSLPSGDPAVDALDAATRRSETSRALKALSVRAAERQPIVMLIEDVHWADAASEEYLGYLAESIPATRTLLVITHRPGYRHTFGDRSYHRRISLDALGADDMAAMAGAILESDQVPEALRALIAAKAEGNPLFVEEVTKSLLEEGVLARENDRIVLARPLDAVAVPGSIHGVLMARLDRLADEPKRALQLASVIGREFALRLLARVTEIGDPVSGLVAELRSLELIYEKAAHPELAYMFKHALTHDVAYESILVQRRKQLHHTIGRAIEEMYADRLVEHYEALALHFTRAEDWERSYEYNRKAAAKALAAYANHSAIAHCRAALAAADRLGERVTANEHADLQEMLGQAYMLVSEFKASGEALERAAASAEDVERRCLDLGWSSNSFVWANEWTTADRVVGEAAALAEKHHLSAGQALALTIRHFVQGVTKGTFDQAAQRQVVELARRSSHDDVQAFALFSLGETHEWTGDYAQAIAYHEESLAVAMRMGNPFLRVMSLWWIGKSTTCLGRYERGLAALREAEALCARIGNRAWQSRLLNTLGWSLAELGDHAGAQPFNTEAARLAHELGDAEILANAGVNLTGNWLATGGIDDAAAVLAPIADALARPGDPWMRWRYGLHVRHAQGRLAIARREPLRALAFADEELAGARRHRAVKLEARAATLRGRALLLLDRREEATAALRAALEQAARIGHPPTQLRTLHLLGELARRDGRRSEADAFAARTQAVVDAIAPAVPSELRAIFQAAALGDGEPQR
jgi:class 3 adenylate cyclase/tetratricopeptide (TPR) repeat protein